MTRLEGSVAAAAFAEARKQLADHELSGPFVRPAVDLVVGSGRAPNGGSEVGPALDGRGPIHEAARRLDAGELTVVELVDQCLAAIDRLDGELNGMAEVTADAAREQARALDAELRDDRRRGPLHGIPMTVKDVIDVAGVPTRAGSDAYLDVPEHDATAVGRLRHAGVVLVGKATTHEFALGVTSPQSHNPHDPSRIPGGSSGGSAVTVASGMCLGSLGTDTRASIRVPAALSGTVGLKATYGRIPTNRIVSLAWTMDHVAPMAASVADAALLLDALDPAMQESWLARAHRVGVTGLRVGVPPATFDDAEPGVRARVDEAIAGLAAAGCWIGPCDRPDASDLDLASAAGLVVSRAEAAAAHRSLGLDRSRYWEEVADQLEQGAEVLAVDYLDAQRARQDLARQLGVLFRDHDVLAMPTVPVVAPRRDDFAAYLMVLARNAIPWSFVGFPAISVPCGSVDGLPVGIQLVAAPGREDVVLAAALLVEAAGS